MILVFQVAWQWLPFTNSARKDDLKLYHWVSSFLTYPWNAIDIEHLLLSRMHHGFLIYIYSQVRVVNGVPPTGDYSFAKYNKVFSCPP